MCVGGEMKKPVNKFAVALWIIAALVGVLGLAQALTFYRDFESATRGVGQTTDLAGPLLRYMAGTITQIAMLVGTGAVIEILDQIRLDAKNRNLDTSQNELGH